MANVIWTIAFLIICTLTDVKERKINIMFCVINQILMTVLNIFQRDFNVLSVMSGLGIGAMFLLINRISKNGIGMGDVFMIVTIGIVCGGTYTMELVFWSFALCSIYSIICIVLKKISLKSSLPLAPFMLLGAVLTCLFSVTS